MFAINTENLKTLKYIYLKKTLSLSIVYNKCGHEYEKNFKEKESIEILKIRDLINNIEEYQKYIIMAEENKSQEFRLKNIDETRNCTMEEINLNEMISKTHKNVCTNLNFIEHFLILATTLLDVFQFLLLLL